MASMTKGVASGSSATPTEGCGFCTEIFCTRRARTWCAVRVEREFFIGKLLARIHFIVGTSLVDRPCAMGV